MATTLNRVDQQTVSGSTNGDGLQVRVRRTLVSDDGGFQLDVAFALERGITILFGPSGAGKTTLLDCIAGLSDPDQGQIVSGSRVLFDSEKRINLSASERKTGYVFQDLALFPHLSVESNVAFGLADLRTEDRKQRVVGALESLDILELRTRRPAELFWTSPWRLWISRSE